MAKKKNPTKKTPTTRANPGARRRPSAAAVALARAEADLDRAIRAVLLLRAQTPAAVQACCADPGAGDYLLGDVVPFLLHALRGGLSSIQNEARHDARADGLAWLAEHPNP